MYLKTNRTIDVTFELTIVILIAKTINKVLLHLTIFICIDFNYFVKGDIMDILY